MNLTASSIIGLTLSLVSSLISHASDKTATPVIIDPAVLNDDPYRFNGIALMPSSRGTGFCAWNTKTFFTAAHVVYNSSAGEIGTSGWDVPPIWLPKVNGDSIETPEIQDSSIQARGYYRWTQYATIKDKEPGPTSDKAFSRDGVLCFAFQDLISGPPAVLNLNGVRDLKTRRSTLITGYPAVNPYRDIQLDGYFLRQTGPLITQYKSRGGNALETTLVTTGPGNSGGPVWTQSRQAEWQAAGILVGGLPSETIIYGFSRDTNSFLRAVTPVIKPKIGNAVKVAGISSSSQFFPTYKSRKIPDGKKSFTNIKIPVNAFKKGSSITKLNFSLDISTTHRGDLFIILQAPDGKYVILNLEAGADGKNFILNNKDLLGGLDLLDGEFFPKDIDPRGTWTVAIQDRLKGDLAVFNSAVLEIAADPPAESTTPPVVPTP